MPTLTTKEALARLAVGDKAILNNKFVFRENVTRYIVNGVKIKRQGNEPIARVQGRVLFAITGDPADVPVEIKRNNEYFRIKMREWCARNMSTCVDCGGTCSPRAQRCRECNRRILSELHTVYPRAACRVCGEQYPVYRNRGRGSRNMLNAAGVCRDCRAEYVRRITSGEMEP